MYHLLPWGPLIKKEKGNLAGMRSPQTQRRRTLGPDNSVNEDHPQGRLLCVRGATQGHPVHICLMNFSKQKKARCDYSYISMRGKFEPAGERRRSLISPREYMLLICHRGMVLLTLEAHMSSSSHYIIVRVEPPRERLCSSHVVGQLRMVAAAIISQCYEKRGYIAVGREKKGEKKIKIDLTTELHGRGSS